ncbi:MAG: hypothetical protein ACFFG0_41330, partial [Candidatus Thorarchaeota archaeon]
ENKTDDYGFLTILIPQNCFNYDHTNQEFIIEIIFNGTYLLDNKTLILNLNLSDIYSVAMYSFQLKFFSFLSVLFIVLIILSYVIINKKGKPEKFLTELTIRY